MLRLIFILYVKTIRLDETTTTRLLCFVVATDYFL